MAASRGEQKAVERVKRWPAHAWPHRLAAALLVVVLGGVYLGTLYPDVRRGDSAELQLMSALLGIAHPQGYALEMLVGKLFSVLPIGPNVAWRVNLLQAVCGVVGALALYGTLHRLTGQILPGIVAALTLAFSTIYWMHSVIAEVYVFYGMFLLLGVYTAVRFVMSDKAVWLYATALLLGVCVGGRPAEVFILPAFVALWLGFRGRVRLRPGRIGVAVPLAVLPFVFTVCFYLVREDPALLHARDDALRDEILEVGTPLPELPFSERVREAVSYSLGLKAAGQADFTAFSWERVGWDLKKYGWLLSGAGAFGDRFPEDAQGTAVVPYPAREQGRGTSISALGLLLALIGVTRWRRNRGAVLLGVVMFLGNLIYYLYMHPVDNLHFTIPGLTGLGVLIGLGVSTRGNDESRRRSLVYQRACFAVPVFLLVTNFGVINFRAPDFRQHLALAEAVKQTPLPKKPAIIAMYARAQRLRYVYWLDAGQTDVRVIVFRERFGNDELRRLVDGLHGRGFTPLISAGVVGKDPANRMLVGGTPRELAEVGLFPASPPPR
ncbi:MAG: DUF2723 domain-containing protein [Planctomycetes bacterium]|nr:DUF2723 domain-containing protein [Planctomycetota bacterium]